MFHLLQVQYLFSTMEKCNTGVRKRFKMELDSLVLHSTYNVILEFVNCKNYVLYILNKWK